LGKAYFHRGRYFFDMTVFHLRQALQLGEQGGDIYEYLGVAYRDLGDFDQSVHYFEQAIEIQPNAMYAVAIAEMLAGEERYEEAQGYVETARELPGAGTLTDRIDLVAARALRESGQYEAALRVYDTVLERNQNVAEAHFGKGETFLAMGTRDRARYEWREAVRLNPNHIESLQRLQEY
jgi:tetratricopeptide (TPR) repeat protein